MEGAALDYVDLEPEIRSIADKFGFDYHRIRKLEVYPYKVSFHLLVKKLFRAFASAATGASSCRSVPGDGGPGLAGVHPAAPHVVSNWPAGVEAMVDRR